MFAYRASRLSFFRSFATVTVPGHVHVPVHVTNPVHCNAPARSWTLLDAATLLILPLQRSCNAPGRWRGFGKLLSPAAVEQGGLR